MPHVGSCRKSDLSFRIIQRLFMDVLVGHENVIGLLERTAEEGRPPHAYLFTGRDGVGKKMAALRFACMLNCPTPGTDRQGTCPTCRKISQGKHPDVYVENPERGMIRIERIRESVRGFFRYAPVEGRYRMAIVDDAHLMNHAAQNALLKTLEEPPPACIIVLVTAKPFLLLSTVRSRCRRVRFGPLPPESMAHLLEEQMGLSYNEALTLAAMSGGSMSRAVEMHGSNFANLREQVVELIDKPMNKGLAGILEFSQTISGDRNRVRETIEIAGTWIRDLIVHEISADDRLIINRDSLDRIESSAQHRGCEELLAAYEELMNASNLIESGTNVNRNLLTDIMLLRITRLLEGPTLGVVAAEG